VAADYEHKANDATQALFVVKYPLLTWDNATHQGLYRVSANCRVCAVVADYEHKANDATQALFVVKYPLLTWDKAAHQQLD